MSTATTTPLFLWLLLLFVAVAVNDWFCYGATGWSNGTTPQTRCVPSEREALLEFKKHLKDSSYRLATWSAAAEDADCCSWYGVSCHHSTAHVLRLHLGSLCMNDYHGDYESYLRYIFGGKISFALLNLKHLRYLDLSCNDFGGISIPSFLGSMGSLTFLNLSEAGFGGIVPHQLGNLSNLQYFNIYQIGNFYDAYVENLQWMSGLSALKFLDLSNVNLSKVVNRDMEILTTLPSLLELHLSNCQLHSPQLRLPNNVDINSSSISFSILDLSHNSLGRQDSTIFLSWVYGLKTLISLNLEGNEFQGPIPRELQNMSSLRELYLDRNGFNSSVPSWLYGHTKLKVLSLSTNLFSSFQPQSTRSATANFSSLSVLDLSYNQFKGPTPNELRNMTSLQQLDLSKNHFNSYIPNWLYGFTRLQQLNLYGNNLEGKISGAIGNMTSLITLYMSQQLGSKLEIEGGISMSFKNFCSLRELDLSGIILRQDINQVIEILSLPGCISNGLEVLRLANCQLFGGLVTTNQNLGRLMFLETLDLAGNNLTGTLPVGLGRLKKLQRLFLYGNSLAGDVSEAHFENLTELRFFHASGNQLTLRVSPNWFPPFDKVVYLNLGSCHLGPQFPTWLRSLKSLGSLTLSSSGISSTIPVWFWNLTSGVDFGYLNLSHNQIHGVLPSTLSQFSSLNSSIDMSSNRLHGLLPLIPSSIGALHLSSNSFSGSISNFLCPPDTHHSKQQWEANSLQVLNLDQNLLYGEMPNCWAAWPSLVIINLSNNKLNGTIPESIGTLGSLESLHLRNNSLSGEVPVSLNKCTNLITIDVGENALVGNISSCINKHALSGMKILNFHSNKLSGPIPEELCHATSLHILDLASNSFDGTIPSCFNNLSAMAKINESTGIIQVAVNILEMYPTFETALLQMKGNMLEYSTNLGFVRSLDLSNNKLSGEIPDEITSLGALVSLNLSHNALSGGIPKNVGFMKGLDSLDLSSNQLSGEIPQSILNLTFLAQLNLSHNRLSGRIPFGPQIQTFDASGFVGNELCGRPLPNNCSVDDTIPNDANDEGDDDGDGMIWFYVSMAFGFVGGFWGFVGPLLLNRRWRFSYSQFLDRLGNRIWRLHKLGLRL